MSEEEVAFNDAVLDVVEAQEDEVDPQAMLAILLNVARIVAAANAMPPSAFAAFLAEEIEENEVAFAMLEAECQEDRKSDVEGKSVQVRVDLGGRRIIKK